ncbi:MAG: ABC transporter substrate-binding protein [Anaerolineae bacterium]|jgi:peptide/nickel transport system substrate-binding protein|nr:ABC transporter substrate-binding protein [Anaerolineae bacterium]
MLRRLLGAVLLLIVVLPLVAQPPDGRGVITIHNEPDSQDSRICSALVCEPIAEWVLPPLFATDPITGEIVPPSADNLGLIEDIQLGSDTQQQLIVRDDLYWSDGQPITAYDVLFNLITWRTTLTGTVTISEEIETITLIDDHTLAVVFTEPDCTTAPQVNVLVRPAHIYGLGFAERVDALLAKDDTPRSLDAWDEAGVLEFRTNYNLARWQNATAGQFMAVDERPYAPFWLVSGETAIIVRDLFSITPTLVDFLSPNMGVVEAFLAGELSYIVNPPVGRRADLLAQPNLQIIAQPSERWALLLFNFADPERPRDAFDADGNPRDQGINPTVGDPAVRQAIRLAIDIDQLVDVVYQGYAQPLNSLWPPTSWAHDPTRTIPEHDLRAAQNLLQAAGWWDSDNDGARECRACTTAPIGTPLNLDMLVDQPFGQVGGLIASQLWRAGIRVNFAESLASEQRFDLYLSSHRTPVYQDPDRGWWFSPAADQRNRGSYAPNFGSYQNEAVSALFDQARTVSTCDRATRRALYSQIQDIFDAETALIPLLVEQDLFVAQPSVLGFDPRPGRPFWNIRDWVVMP